MQWLRFLIIGVVLITGITPNAKAEPQAVTSVAVLPFTKYGGEKTLWLDTAIADLVAQKLVESPHYAVLGHDALQALLKEMEFQQSGFVNGKQDITRVGRVLKADQVMFGTYAAEADTITIKLIVLDTETQKELGQYTQAGAVSNLIALTHKLVRQVLESNGHSLSAAQQESMAYSPTSSLTALEHFYNGMRAYDAGNYEQAMGDFFAATKQDANYLDAGLWFARTLEQLGRDAQAIAAYKKVSAAKPESIEGIDARYFAARLLARTNPEEAVKLYDTISRIAPAIPETLEAAFQQATLLRKMGKVREAYLLYKQVDDYAENARTFATGFADRHRQDDAPSTIGKLALLWKGLSVQPDKENDTSEKSTIKRIADPKRQSRFFQWEHPLGLYRDAVTAMVELYADLPAPGEGEAPLPVPRGAFLVDTANPVVAGDVKVKQKSLYGGDHTYTPNWSEVFYALIIPKGYEATGAELTLTGVLPQPSETRDFTLRIMPFPLQENYHNSWLGVIFGQTPVTTTLTKNVPFFGHTQKLLGVQLVENAGRIERWQVRVHLRKSPVDTPSPAPRAESTTDGALIAKVRLGNENDRTIRTQPQYITFLQPKQKLALANNFNDGVWLVGVKGDLAGEETNLWVTHSGDSGRHWETAQPLAFNSASLEFAPQLIRREDGNLQLFFLSNRRGQGWELWSSMLDRASKRWENARLVPLGDFAPTGFEDEKNLTASILAYSVLQDAHGQWNVAFYSRKTQKVHLITSSDLVTWKPLAELALSNTYALALGQDATARSYLVATNGRGQPLVYTSGDGVHWKQTSSIARSYGNPMVIASYPMALLPDGDGVTYVFSDPITGLQYARLDADKAATPDLVTQSAMDAFAITTTDEGYLTAQWKDDNVHIQRFRHLAFPDNGVNPTGQVVYKERSKSAKGEWERIFARDRFRVPDTTAIAAVKGGRIWWGIETGIMSLKGSDFFMRDVSQGFFHHFVDRILPCNGKVWFASSPLVPARVGYNNGTEPNPASLGSAVRLDELSGPVVATACSAAGDAFFADASGTVVMMPAQGNRTTLRQTDAGKYPVGALAYDDKTQRLLLGNGKGEVLAQGEAKPLFTAAGHAITALAVDAQGFIWAAAKDDGLYHLSPGGKLQRHFTAKEVGSTLRKLVADNVQGVWGSTDHYEASRGLVYATGDSLSMHNPPQGLLSAVTDYTIAEDNSLWIGTNIDGIYHYTRKP